MLEKLLSKKRTTVVNKLISSHHRKGRILDIGCGEYPYFLINTRFHEKYGIDRLANDGVLNNQKKESIFIKKYDIEKNGLEFFGNEYFDVVTMLAVFEHLDTGSLPYIIKEIKRVLKFNGAFILTTPAAWSNGILKVLSRLKLINTMLFEEHKEFYDEKKISLALVEGGFSKENIKFGNFELFMNIWSMAIR